MYMNLRDELITNKARKIRRAKAQRAMAYAVASSVYTTVMLLTLALVVWKAL